MRQQLLRLTLAFAMIVPLGGALALATPLAVNAAYSCSNSATMYPPNGTTLYASASTHCTTAPYKMEGKNTVWRCSSMWWGSCLTWDVKASTDLICYNTTLCSTSMYYSGATGNRYRNSEEGWINDTRISTVTSNEVNT